MVEQKEDVMSRLGYKTGKTRLAITTSLLAGPYPLQGVQVEGSMPCSALHSISKHGEEGRLA